MKKTILILSISFAFVACHQKKAQTDLNSYPDSSMNNNYPSNAYNNQPAATYPTTHYRTSTRPVYYHRTRYTSRSAYPARTTVIRRKRGWSRAAKGAVIGAGSGAV